jgi:DNA polymerase-3 subunit beta
LADKEKQSFTLPAKPVSLIKTLFTGNAIESGEKGESDAATPIDDTIRITVYVNYATFEREDMRLQCRLLEGKYPNCESVIPKDNDKSIIADRGQLLSAFRRVSIFANDATKLVNLVLSSGQLQLDAKDLGYSTSAQEQLTVNYTGEEKFEIAFSAMHFTKILSILPSEHVEILLGDRAHAAIITPQEKDDDESIIAVDMPLLI